MLTNAPAPRARTARRAKTTWPDTRATALPVGRASTANWVRTIAFTHHTPSPKL
ncbi:hypothetical protein DPMN_140693 [Dreissena polymorpha]|uniref:Uncharacterized protein n=1 Tax=Dreissena polymorpha TaxID=45954 RepID=A0A9D4GDZ8_DREPO|nr:hypothetical protein DPMN_140693 [Dreissena polymorpha]